MAVMHFTVYHSMSEMFVAFMVFIHDCILENFHIQFGSDNTSNQTLTMCQITNVKEVTNSDDPTDNSTLPLSYRKGFSVFKLSVLLFLHATSLF